MNIAITGSLGNISKPLAIELVQKGHSVTVISSQPERKQEIEALGAKAAIGKIQDLSFLKDTFEGQDTVYCMLPPFNFFGDSQLDYKNEARQIAANYLEAIRQAGVKKVIHLSSVGAEKKQGTGLLEFHYIVEQVLKQLPDEISLTHIRPANFDYNLYQFMDMIKGNGFLKGFIGKILYLRHYGISGLLKGHSGLILSNYGADDLIAWVSPKDIAAAIAEEVENKSFARNTRYVASEELTCQQVARIIGEAIGKPYLKWVLISDKQMISALTQFGASDQIARDLTQMNKTTHDGSLFEDYFRNRPVLGKTKMKDFAVEFAAKYRQA